MSTFTAYSFATAHSFARHPALPCPNAQPPGGGASGGDPDHA